MDFHYFHLIGPWNVIILLSAGRKQNGKNKALLFGGPDETEKRKERLYGNP